MEKKWSNFDSKKFCAIAINLGNHCREKLKQDTLYIYIYMYNICVWAYKLCLTKKEYLSNM